MGSITDMGLYVWDGATDPYNYQQLAQNFEILTFHDHTPGRGAQITSGALAPGSVGSVNFDTTAQSFISAASHLKYTLVTSLPFTASDGQFVSCFTAGTYSLPSASVANQTIAFVNNQVGGSTIARSGSDLIYVEGAWGVTSIPLAALGATITLQSDGGGAWVARTTPGRLQFVNAAVNTTAAHGQLVNAVPGVTITLPAAAANGVVGVMAFSNVTGTTPVIVRPSGGAHIFGLGLGLGGATSFVLGTGNACVVLQADGANWTMLSGQQDTGWVPLSFHTADLDPVVASAFVRSYRLQGDTVTLSGASTFNNATFSLGQIFGDPIIPAATVTPSIIWQHGGVPVAGQLRIDNVGNVGLISATGPSVGDFISFDNVHYRLV